MERQSDITIAKCLNHENSHDFLEYASIKLKQVRDFLLQESDAEQQVKKVCNLIKEVKHYHFDDFVPVDIAKDLMYSNFKVACILRQIIA